VLYAAGGQATLGMGRFHLHPPWLSMWTGGAYVLIHEVVLGGGCGKPCDMVCMGGGCEGVRQVPASECMWGA